MRGSYSYLLDGRPAPITENFWVAGPLWSSSRHAGGTTLTVEARETSKGRFDDVHLSFRSESIHCDLAIERDQGAWRWQRSTERDAESCDAVDGTAYVFPLLRCFQGQAVQAIHASGVTGCLVAVPDITDPSDRLRWFQPRLDVRRVTRRGDGWFDYLGGSYDNGAACVIAADGLLERYTWDQPGVGSWDVRLSRAPAAPAELLA